MFEQIILILLAILFLIVLPIISTFKYWNFKPFMKYVLILMWISYSVIVYEVFFPRDSYYVNHLKNVSNIEFDDSIKIKDKFTSLLNFKSQYYSCAVFEISNSDKVLLKSLKIETNEKTLDLNNECIKILNPFIENKTILSSKNLDEKQYRQWGYIEGTNYVFVIYQYFAMANK